MSCLSEDSNRAFVGAKMSAKGTSVSSATFLIAAVYLARLTFLFFTVGNVWIADVFECNWRNENDTRSAFAVVFLLLRLFDKFFHLLSELAEAIIAVE